MGIWIAIVTRCPNLLFAEETIATGNRERYNDAVTSMQIGHFLSHFFDNAHELMPKNVA